MEQENHDDTCHAVSSANCTLRRGALEGHMKAQKLETWHHVLGIVHHLMAIIALIVVMR